MKQFVVALSLITLSLAGFTGYCYAWLDWVIDLTTGVYGGNRWEAAYETGALLLYTYGALRFMTRRLNK